MNPRHKAGDDELVWLSAMTIHKPNFFVVTGGGGTGKTTLIRRLEAMGELVVEENARAVIRDEAASGGFAVPWVDPKAFCDLTTKRDIADFDRLAGEGGRVFFDRGIIDMWGANGVPPSPALVEANRTRRYNARVFVAPPWEEIYETDAERRQDWSEMQAVFDRTLRTLPELGYEPVILPRCDVATRAAFVLERT